MFDSVIWTNEHRWHIICDTSAWSCQRLDWIEQCFTSPPTQYRLYGRRDCVNKLTNSLPDRMKHCCYCEPNLPTFEELCQTTDDQLFNKTVFNPNTVLHTLLPPLSTASQRHNLKRRVHTHSLPGHDSYLWDCNFIIQMLYKVSY